MEGIEEILRGRDKLILSTGNAEIDKKIAEGLPLSSLTLIEGENEVRFQVLPKRGGLLRSAAIALGNHPHPPSFESLAAALDDDEPVVRGAAAWALGRWISAGVLEAECRTALARRREIETDAEVAAEIATGETLGVSAGGPSGQTS